MEILQNNEKGRTDRQDSLNSVLRDALVPIVRALAALYLFFALAHSQSLPADIVKPMIFLSLGTAMIATVLWWRWNRVPLAPNWAHSGATFIVAFIATNVLTHLYLTAEMKQSINISLLIVGVGCFYLSRAWVLSVVSLLLAAWAAAVSMSIRIPDWEHYVYVQVVACVLAGLVHTLRRHAMLSLYEQRLVEQHDAQRLKESEASIQSAYQEVERKVDERTQELAESKRRYQDLCELLPQPVFETDLDGHITFWNESGLRLFGYTRADVDRGVMNLDLIAPKDRARAGHSMRRRLKGEGIGGVQYSMLTSDGRTFPALVYSDVIRQGETPTGFRGLVIDISDQVKSQSALRVAHNDLERLIDTANTPILGTDMDGKTTVWNRAAEELLGYSRDEIIGKNIMCETGIGRKLRSLEEPMRHVLSGAPLKNKEIHLETESGRSLCLVFNAVPRLDDEGRIVGSFIIAQDITKRKQVEEELSRERTRLEEAVAERTRELKGSLEQLEYSNVRLREMNDHKSRFLSSMSHELRTPLNAILGFSDLLRGEGYGPLNPKQSRYVEQIDISGLHLLSLIENLLDLATIDSGEMKVEIGRFSVDECIGEVVEIMSEKFRAKNIGIRMHIDRQVTHVQCDLGKSRQITFNLLTNALKYTPEGGRVEVRVSKQDESMARISVEDTGIGISEDETCEIFSEFRRGSCAINEKTDGVGLGLALSRRLVTIQGGEIGVHSELGKGSTFWFTLPSCPSDKKTDLVSEEPYREIDRSSTKRRILLAEDNEANVELTVDMLTDMGHEVVVATNGQEALELAQTYDPDLVLMDIRMPVMDGYEATRRLRAMAKFSEVPIVALTAYADDESIQRCLDVGCSGHIPKPINSRQLNAAILSYPGNCASAESVPGP